MNPLTLILVLGLHQPPGTPEATMQAALRRVYGPLLAALLRAEDVRVGLYVSGPLLRWLDARQPAYLDALRGLVARGQVEPVGGGFGWAFLGDLPPEDAEGQVRTHADHVKRRLGERPRGALPAEGVWEARLPEIYRKAGLGWALIDDRQLLHVQAPGACEGLWVTEVQGEALRLLPASSALARQLGENPPHAFARELGRRARAAPGAVAVSARLEAIAARVGPDELVSWLRALLTLFAKQGHWLKTELPSARVARMPTLGRVHPGDWVPPRVARWLLPPEAAQRLLAYEERARRHPATRSGPPLPRGASWKEALALHEEANRLHKRLRLCSRSVALLRHALEQDADPARLQTLSEARLDLYAVQGADALWHGPEGGVHDPALRHAVWAGIASVEARVDRAPGAPRAASVHVGDHDGDGFDEVLVRTPRLSAMVDPEAGGGLTELLFHRLPGNVLNGLTRREEGLHQALRRFSTAPALVGEDDETEPPPDRTLPQIDIDSDTESELTAIPTADEADGPLLDALHLDRVPRAAFQDHFLGLPVRVERLMAGQHDERGDFWGAPYKLESAEPDDEGGCAVLLTREGVVREGRVERLVRVIKRFSFHRDLPGLRCRYEVANRADAPVTGLFAVELTVNLDGADPRGLTLRADGGPARAADLPEAWGRAGRVELSDERAGWGLTLISATPALVWHHPVSSVGREGMALRRRAQGTCLILGWDLSLWGQERARIDLELRVDPG